MSDAAPAPVVAKVVKAKKVAKPAAHPPFKAMLLAAIPPGHHQVCRGQQQGWRQEARHKSCP